VRVKEWVIRYVAADLIQTAKGGGSRGSSLKNVISNLMICTAMSNLVVIVLCLLVLTRHRTNLAVSSDKAVKETLEEGWDPTGKGHAKEFTFAVDDHATNFVIEKVTLEAFEFVLQGLAEGALPTVDQAKEFVGRTGGKGVLLKYKIPNAASSLHSVKSPDDLNFRATMTSLAVQQHLLHNLDSLDDDDFNDDDPYKSIYEINNATATIDIPIHSDLNSTAVVHSLVDYYVDLTMGGV
jgi:hypothetical protein